MLVLLIGTLVFWIIDLDPFWTQDVRLKTYPEILHCIFDMCMTLFQIYTPGSECTYCSCAWNVLCWCKYLFSGLRFVWIFNGNFVVVVVDVIVAFVLFVCDASFQVRYCYLSSKTLVFYILLVIFHFIFHLLLPSLFLFLLLLCFVMIAVFVEFVVLT